MGAVAAISQIVGGGMQAVGSLEAGDAAAKAGEYNAGVADYNAAQTENEGAIAVTKQQRQATQVIGQAKAAYGASGVDSNQGSALQVLQQSATQAAIDSLNLKHQYDAKAYGYRATAAIDRYNGDQAKTASYFTAAGQLLAAGGAAGKSLAGAA